MRPAPFDPPLLLVTDRQRFEEPREGELFAAQEWRVLEAAVEAGVGAVQLREKDLDGRALYQRAVRLVSMARGRSTRILVNDRADVAAASLTHGVHLPALGLPAQSARRLVGTKKLVGRSIHQLDELAQVAGLDYLIFGPIFDTPSKRRYGTPQGLERLRAVTEASPLPVFAIGGITPERVEAVLTHGAAGVAVMGAILSATDPGHAVRRYREALE